MQCPQRPMCGGIEAGVTPYRVGCMVEDPPWYRRGLALTHAEGSNARRRSDAQTRACACSGAGRGPAQQCAGSVPAGRRAADGKTSASETIVKREPERERYAREENGARGPECAGRPCGSRCSSKTQNPKLIFSA